MLMVPIDEAKAGMKLVMAVWHPEEPDQELLKPGFVLTESVLAKLRSLGVPFLYVDYPDLADLDRHLMAHLSPARQQIYSHMKNTIAAVQKTARPTVTFPDYYMATRELVITLLQQGEHPIYMDILCGRLGTDEVSHATAVAQLSVTLGIRLEQYLIRERSRLSSKHAREVVNLGVGAMLHDIGKAKLPEHLQRYHGVLPPEKDADRTEWETHARVGHGMLMHGIEASAAAAVLQHHQHFDGSGFPAIRRKHAIGPLREHDIHIFARIIQAADLYDRLTLAPDGRRRPPIEILHLMRTQYAAWLDPQVLKLLPAVIPPFPPGSRLTLSDNSLAVVVNVDPDDPYRPTVRRLGEDHWTLSGDPIALSKDEGIRIHALEGQVVKEMVEAGMREVEIG